MFLCPHPLGQIKPPSLGCKFFCSLGPPSASARQRRSLEQGLWALWAQGFPCWEAGWVWTPCTCPSEYVGWSLMDACGRNLFWLFRAKEGMYGEDPGSKDRMHWSSRIKLGPRALRSLFLSPSPGPASQQLPLPAYQLPPCLGPIVMDISCNPAPLRETEFLKKYAWSFGQVSSSCSLNPGQGLITSCKHGSSHYRHGFDWRRAAFRKKKSYSRPS